jgi:hypothetical protein
MRFRLTVVLVVGVLATSAAGAQSEVRLGGQVISARQNLLRPQGILQGTGSLTGIELLAGGSGAGIYARYLTGSVGSASIAGTTGDLRAAEGRLWVGSLVFSIEGGYLFRARAPGLSGPRDNILLGGARSMIALGPSGLSVGLTVTTYVRMDSVESDDPQNPERKLDLVGWEATTGVFYQAPRGIPLYASLGYRYERLRTPSGTPPVHREELSGLVLSGGFRKVTKKPSIQ